MGSRSRFVGVAAMSLLPVVVGAASAPGVTAGIATAISMFWISVAAGVDRMCRRLPDALVALAFLPTAMAAAVLTLHGSPTAVTGSGCGAAAWGLPLLVAHLVAPAGLGFGDVKAGVVIGATLGLTQHALVVAGGLAAALAIAALTAGRSRRHDVALGPYLAGGAGVSLGIALVTGEGS